jgi:AhpD family alkylhydroperoxidase
MSMIRLKNSPRQTAAAIVTALSFATIVPALAADAAPVIATPSEADVVKDITQTFGGVPTFVTQFPKSALAALWLEERDLELNPNTALDAKTKALISLAVASQIPCQYCIWSDTMGAKQAGATDQEIAEAVAMAGLTRNYSTLFNGLQVDFEQFKKELTPPSK